MPTPNYSPDLERAQLLEDFKVVDAKFNQLTGDRNDTRLERAKLLLAMQQTFPITNTQTKNRAGWKEWCEANLLIAWRTVTSELSFARDPNRLTRHRVVISANPNAWFNRSMSSLKKWPTWTDEQRQKVIDRVVEYANA